MLPALTLVSSLAFCTGEPAQPPMTLPPVLEAQRRQMLSAARAARELARETIMMYEEADRLGLFSPEKSSRYRQRVTELRQRIDNLNVRERELWEQQPGGITAPPPRPKGTLLRPATGRD